MNGTIFIGKDGVYMDGVLISEPIRVPHPDYEVSRMFWDKATRSVKQEIIPITDMYEQPSNKSVEEEKRNRIRAALFAYAYEFMNVALIPDSEYDELCMSINPQVSTGNEVMDNFFREQFDTSTGMWIHHHPDLNGIKRIYNLLVGEEAA